MRFFRKQAPSLADDLYRSINELQAWNDRLTRENWQLRADRDSLLAVVEAAKRWRDAPIADIAAVLDAGKALIAAVDALAPRVEEQEKE